MAYKRAPFPTSPGNESERGGLVFSLFFFFSDLFSFRERGSTVPVVHLLYIITFMLNMCNVILDRKQMLAGLQKMAFLLIASRWSCLHLPMGNMTAFANPLLICYEFLTCCEIRYHLRETAAGQDHALFSVKTSPF